MPTADERNQDSQVKEASQSISTQERICKVDFEFQAEENCS